jgi:hypothetical protein
MEQKSQILKLLDIELVHLLKIIGESERVSPKEYNCKTIDELSKHIDCELHFRQICHIH